MKILTTADHKYDELLKRILQHLRKPIEKVARHKVETCWHIGKAIDGHLQQHKDRTYGEELIHKLERDTTISEKSLYRMRNFYKSYIKLPRDNNKLNWTHYRALASIKDINKRKHFEILTHENNWGGELSQKKTLQPKAKKIPEKEIKSSETPS